MPSTIADPLAFLYSAIEPSQFGYLAVGDGHEIWWEESGNPAGVPVLYLHGGPGAPGSAAHRRFFDPDFYRLVVFHQRGCGRSLPLARIEANTTWHLVADIERLRVHLGIDQWFVAGGSWGSCLALVYGETYPDRCLGFRLRGVSLGRASDIHWWWDGTSMLFPEAYDELMAVLSPEERDDPLPAFHKRLTDPSREVQLRAAQAIKLYSGRTVHVRENVAKQAEAFDPDLSLPMARLFAHYSVHRFFLENGQILRDLHRISHLPCVIVQGRFDVTTPAEGAWALHKAWPGSTIHMVSGAAHDELDEPLARILVQTHDAIKEQLRARE
ncbi:prolyl aminopeptidase [Govanella unica]|uniref:Proline iminopeptidase n=1 Tax=Govanella unica TaxID=2975056 RepID=A0A9X3Z617_9PROT|nr:prolyl aminopeptidase [Govania unica]MDA5192676.1 prolyl aminopeptidase [Govania unica]